jgi:hypothetical protein
MRKFIYAVAVLLISTTVQLHSQTPKAVALFENFDAVSLPASWTIVDSLNDSNTWEFISAYQANTLDGTPFAMVNSDAAGAVALSEQLITPALDVSGYATVFVEFDHYFREFGGGGSEIGDVDVWNGSSWVNIYSVNITTGSWGAPDHQYIDASAYKNAAFKVRFRYYNANNDYYWSVDNVRIWDPQPNDVGIASVVAPLTGYNLSATETVSVLVKNYGLNAQNSIPVHFQVDNGTVVNETLDNTYSGFTSLAAGDTFTYVFTATADLTGFQTHEVKAWTGLGTDTDHANDTLVSHPENIEQFVQLSFDALESGTFGVETNGNYFFVSFWTDPGLFARYTMAGVYVDTFRIASLAVGIRDMAYDPVTGHFFGGAATPVIYELALDSVIPTLIGQVSTPSGATVRYIAYDDVRDGFWVGNLTGDIYLVDKAGALITVAGVTNPILNASLTGAENRYGLAFDNWSCPGEYLWAFCQPGTPSNIVLAEIDIATGLPTGRTLDVTSQLSLTGANPTSAGLFTHPDLITGTVSVGGLIQNAYTGPTPNMVFLLDLEGLHPTPQMTADDLFPANSASDVHLDHNLIVTFFDSIVLNSAAGITIMDGTTPVANISAVVDGKVLTISHDDFVGLTTYTATIPAGTVTGDCSDNLEVVWSFTTGTVGVDENSAPVIGIFPNPATGSFTIAGAQNSMVSVYTISGVCVSKTEIENAVQTINIEELPAGMYVVEVVADGCKVVEKLVVND